MKMNAQYLCRGPPEEADSELDLRRLRESETYLVRKKKTRRNDR